MSAGKGSAPRNMGPKFRENYDAIFRRKKPAKAPGEHEVARLREEANTWHQHYRDEASKAQKCKQAYIEQEQEIARLREQNAPWAYPLQLRSSSEVTTLWIKHRWEF